LAAAWGSCVANLEDIQSFGKKWRKNMEKLGKTWEMIGKNGQTIQLFSTIEQNDPTYREIARFYFSSWVFSGHRSDFLSASILLESVW